jgi:adenylylsulfate kinase
MINKTKQKEFILWIAGPTSSGKTTISEALIVALRKKEIPAIHFDGDEVRGFFGPQFGFSEENRMLVVDTIIHLANKMLDAGLNVIVSALTANENAREAVRNNVKNLILTTISCSITECIKRDPKGLYTKAQKGEINTLIGLNSEYLELDNPDLMIKTEGREVEVCVSEIITFLGDNAYINLDS